MSKVVVIGATGHIGTYLVPRLVRAGHEVVAVSRGQRAPYTDDPAWAEVSRVQLDRDDAGFDGAVRDLGGDVVVDLTAFTLEQAGSLAATLRDATGLLVHCGTVWVHGPTRVTPIRETDARNPIGEYGTQKAAIEDLLLADDAPLPATVLRPGHISGPGWASVNPIGNLDTTVWERLATGGQVVAPFTGAETMHHVHADDVAQAFAAAVDRADVVAGRAYNVVSERAWSTIGLAHEVAEWFGRSPELTFVGLDEFRTTTDPEHADASYEHLRRSHAMSIDRARADLGYAPRWTSPAALGDSLLALADAGRVDLGDGGVDRLRAAAARDWHSD